MNFIEKTKRMEYLLEMIEKDRCISLEQVANKFECSKRTVQRLIELLKDDGHKIKYCKKSRKFLKKF